MSMLGEITHLQTLTDDLKLLTMDPHKLPASSEQVSELKLIIQNPKDLSERPDGPRMRRDSCVSVCRSSWT